MDSTTKPRKFSFWQVVYALSSLGGAGYMIDIAFSENNAFPIPTFILAIVCLSLGLAILLRARIALYLYVSLALVLLLFGGYRVLTARFTPGMMGLVIGPLVMLCSTSMITEELRKRPA